jgi:hypothetical protein
VRLNRANARGRHTPSHTLWPYSRTWPQWPSSVMAHSPQPTAQVVKAGDYRSTSASSPVRQSLLDKGLVYAPRAG